ncbi:MAG: VOC family protein [Candidatus Nanopelagicales bacterium]
MRLDHVSYAVNHEELADTVQRFGGKLGAAFSDGGRHPHFGTQNFILPLQDNMYIEVVAALEHPAAERAPFGQAVRQRAESGGGWLGWVVSVSDLAPFEARLGREAVRGHRRRPDGYELAWRQLGVIDLIEDPQVPFFITWESPASEHPSRGANGVRISKVEIAGDAERVADWLGEPSNHPLDAIDVEWVSMDDASGIVAITFETAQGPIRLD